MKSKMKRSDLMSKVDIANAVMDDLSESTLSSENTTLKKAIIVYQYYSELESGGHESLFRWFGTEIQAMGIDNYSHQLIGILEEIGAHRYATIEKTYLKELWNLYVALENGEVDEDKFYDVVEKATDAYHKLNGELRDFMEDYFVAIYTDLIEVVED